MLSYLGWRNDQITANRVDRYDEQGVAQQFLGSWWKGAKPDRNKIKAVYSVRTDAVQRSYQDYKSSLSIPNTEDFYHGTVLKCNLMSSGVFCSNSSCGICGISQYGFSSEKLGLHVQWYKRFGLAYYLAPNSSKCHEYTEGYNGHRALLCCEVAQGNRFVAKGDMRNLKSAPAGYDTVYGQPGVHKAGGSSLNYAEVAVYNPKAILPKWIIFCEWNGTKLLL